MTGDTAAGRDLLSDSVIEAIDMVPVGVALPPGTGYGSVREIARRRAATLVFARTRAGVIGVGECFGPPDTTVPYLPILRDNYIGRSLLDHRAIWRAMTNRLYHVRARSQLGSAISGLDIAIHDALGKLTGVPVYRLLGGAHCDSVPVYASGGYYNELDARDLAGQLERVAGRFHAYKIKIGSGPADDLKRVALARRIVGDDADLMVDINGAYTLDTALESMNLIARHNPYWVEEPLAPEDLPGYRRLAGRAPLRIASGEAAITAPEFVELSETGSVDVLMPDLNLCGGFVEGLRVADHAHLAGLRVSPHVWGAAVGLVAAMHYVAAMPVHPHVDANAVPAYVEYDVSDNPLSSDLLTEAPAPRNGRLAMPAGPGLGIEIDDTALERLKLT